MAVEDFWNHIKQTIQKTATTIKKTENKTSKGQSEVAQRSWAEI